MINKTGKNIDIVGSFVYVYTTAEYEKKGWFKIGGTDYQSVLQRVKQQDTTSTAEELIIYRAFELRFTKFNEKSAEAENLIRSKIEEKGGRLTRIDAYREWRICTLDEIDTIYCSLLDPEFNRSELVLLPHQKNGL